MSKTAHHPQSWCQSCAEEDCRGEHFGYGQVSASNSSPDLLDDHATVPMVSVGNEWIEWEQGFSEPSVYIEVGDSEARMNLKEAQQILLEMTNAVENLRALLSSGTHLLCDCGVQQLNT